MLTQSETLDVLAALGVEVDHVAGEEIWALCPMHERRTGKPDNHPSWSLNHDKASHNCFSCGYTGHLVELVADLRDVDLGRARRWLRRAGASLEMAENLPTWGERQSFATPVAKPVADNVKWLLREGFVLPPADAMARRKVTAAAVAHYGAAWHPKERGWVLPVRLPDGEYLGYQFKRKAYVRNRPPKVQKSSTLFGIHCLRTTREAILVESPLDCMYLHSIGIYGAVSSYGAHVSDAQMRMLIEHVDKVVLALDNDAAGLAETKRLITGVTWVRKKPVQGIVWPRRVPVFVFNYGDAEGKDPGELERPEVYRGLRESEHDLEWMARHGGPHQSPSVPVSKLRT